MPTPSKRGQEKRAEYMNRHTDNSRRSWGVAGSWDPAGCHPESARARRPSFRSQDT